MSISELYQKVKVIFMNGISLIKADYLNLGTKLKIIEKRIRKKKTNPYCNYAPSSIAIEITSACNFNCAFCIRKELKIPPKKLSKNRIKKLISSIKGKGVKNIYLFGVGEPLLYPIDDLVEIINFAAKYVPCVSFATNGSLLKGEIAKKLAKSKLSDIRISVDSPNPEIYKRIRNFDLKIIKENIKNFTLLSKIPVRIQAVLTKETEKDFTKLPEFCKEIGAKILYVNKLHETEYYKGMIKEPEKIEKIEKELIRKCKTHNLKLGLNLRDAIILENSQIICREPFYQAYINCEGYLTPCSMMPHIKLKKANEVMEVWNSKEIIDFRKKIINGNYPDWCVKKCGVKRF
ncbi:MAG: radical SAM/SPASM domain-containing protein [Candidatus Woesearchaeota archaeon]